MSYLFYALESSGGSFPFDQVLEFAGIRTDEEFAEQDRHLLRVSLRPDVVPSPRFLADQDRPMNQMQQGMSELEAIRRIHGWFNQPGTVSLGYDSLGFADEMIRFAFFRNLLDPYTHQWENNCGRMDLLPMLAVYWVTGSSVLKWPDPDEANPLDLEALDRVNDLVEEESGGAIYRVKVVTALARALAREEQRWDDLRDQFDKNIDRDRLGRLPTVTVGGERYPVAQMVDGQFGRSRSYQRPALCLGSHRHYRNRSMWLTLDSAQLRAARQQSIARHTDVISRKFGVPTFLFAPDDERVVRGDEKQRAVARRNIRWLQNHASVFHQIAGFYLERTHTDAPNVDVDAALYRFGFMSDRDRRVAERFHREETPEAMLELSEQFEAAELRELAVRVVLRNTPPSDWPDRVRSYAEWYWRRIRPRHHADVLIDHRGVERRTPKRARKQIRAMRSDPHLDERKQDRLDELVVYLEDGLRPAPDPTVSSE